MKRIAMVAALVAVLAGAGTGIALAVRGGPTALPADARAHLGRIERMWRTHVRAGTTHGFPSPPRSWLNRQLREAAQLCGCFTVLKVEFVHSGRPSPWVVAEATDEDKIATLANSILDLVDRDPPGPSNDHWAYAGFFFQFQKPSGVPFLASALWPESGTPGGVYPGGWAAPRVERYIMSHFAHG